MSHLILIIATLSLVLGGVARGTSEPAESGASSDATQRELLVEGWVVKKSNHVCGLSDAKKLSSPAKVDYQKCLEATAPWKEMEDEGIEEESAEGKALRAKAVRIVAKAAEKIRKEQGYCSVWKKVEHSDGREINAITDDVVDEVEEDDAA